MPNFIIWYGDYSGIVTKDGLEILVDTEDVPFLFGHTWLARKRGHHKSAYATAKIDGRQILIHRYLMNAKKGEEIDHIDCNGLNNRKRNLRLATRSENQHNRGAYATNKSGAKGVHFNKCAESNSCAWIAYIKINGRAIYLGSFSTVAAAAAAYEKAAVAYHGEFARVK